MIRAAVIPIRNISIRYVNIIAYPLAFSERKDVIQFTVPRSRPKVMNAPGGRTMMTQSGQTSGKTRSPMSIPVPRISRTMAILARARP